MKERAEILKNLPILETEHLTLRKLCMKDLQDMFEYAVDPEIASLGLWLPFYSLDDSKQDLLEILDGYAQGKLIS